MWSLLRTRNCTILPLFESQKFFTYLEWALSQSMRLGFIILFSLTADGTLAGVCNWLATQFWRAVSDVRCEVFVAIPMNPLPIFNSSWHELSNVFFNPVTKQVVDGGYPSILLVAPQLAVWTLIPFFRLKWMIQIVFFSPQFSSLLLASRLYFFPSIVRRLVA